MLPGEGLDSGLGPAQDEGMNAIIFQTKLYGVLIRWWRFATRNVNRVSRSSERRDEFSECGVEVLRHVHELQAMLHTGIGQ